MLSSYKTSPSFIRETPDFKRKLKEIKEPLPDNSLLFCFYVVKLYLSVPSEEGLKVCEEALSMRLKPFVAAEGVMEMIRTVLYNNNFVLGEKNYIQTDGVAIGSRLSKNFSCAYMRKWDENMFTAPIQPAFYKRFVDDGFGVWTGTKTELKEFAAFANTIHKNIKVELRYHERHIEFLDTLVKIENGHIYTDLYI